MSEERVVALPPPRAFQGVIPAIIATCAADGTPNVTYVSQVFRIDDRRFALSCQFFNKTKQNVVENPFVTIEIHDPLSYEAYRMELRYLHSETSGPLFDTMALRIQAIASHTGMAGVFRLISADVYELIASEKLEDFLVPAPDVPPPVEISPGPRTELRGLQLMSQRLSRATTLEELLDTTLSTLEEAFGFEHAIIFLRDESSERLFAIASRGYGEDGVGAEVLIGEGLIGTVAQERRPLRLSGVDVELRYGRAVRASLQQTSARRSLRPEIELPGLPDAQSHMALPLIAGERLIGVLAVESRERLGFEHWDEAFFEIVTNTVAVALDSALLRDGGEEQPEEQVEETPPSRAVAEPHQKGRRFRFFDHDDCVFVDDDYLIRNVPGRILWKLLRAHADTGRNEFTNRELRLDPWLGLPPVRDNLESRLVLLRKRLEQKCPELRLVPTARGRFRLEATCRLQLEEGRGEPPGRA